MALELNRKRFLSLVIAGSVAVAGLGVAAAAGGTAAGGSAAAPATGSYVSVRLTPWLAHGTASRGRLQQIDYRAGLTPAEIAQAHGIRGSDLGSVMAVVNGVQVDLAAPLAAGDRLELITGMAGG
ncbi:MAG TPA: MoaD/ThiS family protein [Dehalococcoidia bacterium]|nr:MoaD/ThiS family protein [Dehalococcoidia bacterium]